MSKMSKKRNTIIISILLAAMMAFSCTACAAATTVQAAELSAGYKRKATGTGEITEEFQAAMADFSMELFRGLITKDEENDLISPLSAILCLAMLANGADGETKAQMEDAFGMDIETLNECLYAYTSSLYTAKDCKLSIADSIWFRDDKNMLQVNEEFLQTNADWYDAQVYAAPFDETTLKDINNWCKKHTDGMIDRILDDIDPGMMMYLMNALVFDAEWQEKYEKNKINNNKFTNYDGSITEVSYLHSEESVYLSGDGVTGFAKNYAGGKYSFVGLLPEQDKDIYDYVESLTGETWRALWNGRTYESVTVKMPEFTYATDMMLKDVLTDMGMADMFDSGKADFSKLGTTSDDGNLYCSFVKQKVFIQVERNGTKAAAITSAGLKNEFMSEIMVLKEVRLERPFVYAIVDNATGLPLFLGAVTNME